MSYKIVEYVANEYSKIELIKSNMFKKAVWTMTLAPVDNGTKVTCEVDFSVNPSHLYLVPALLFSNKKALTEDLDCLKQAIEMYYK
jgi:hypothetical protein